MGKPILKFLPRCACHQVGAVGLTPVEPWLDYEFQDGVIHVILVHRPTCKVCGKPWRVEVVKK